jgi:dihydroneopterin aldolase
MELRSSVIRSHPEHVDAPPFGDASMTTDLTSPSHARDPGPATSCVVRVADLRIDALIGVLGCEYGRPQPLIVDVDITIAVPEDDDLAETIDYRMVLNAARELAGSHIALIETFALRLGKICLAMERAIDVRVAVRKPHALSEALAGTVVHMRRPAFQLAGAT